MRLFAEFWDLLNNHVCFSEIVFFSSSRNTVINKLRLFHLLSLVGEVHVVRVHRWWCWWSLCGVWCRRTQVHWSSVVMVLMVFVVPSFSGRLIETCHGATAATEPKHE